MPTSWKQLEICQVLWNQKPYSRVSKADNLTSIQPKKCILKQSEENTNALQTITKTNGYQLCNYVSYSISSTTVAYTKYSCIAALVN